MYGTNSSARLEAAGDSLQSYPVEPTEGLCAIGRQFEQLARRNGLDYFVLTRFPHGDRPEFAANFVMGNWPAEMQALYETSDTYGFSKVISSLKETIVPFFSREAVFLSDSVSRNDRAQAAAFARHGLRAHLAFSLHDTDLNQYVVVFSGDVEALERDKIAALYLASVELLDICGGRTRQQEGPRDRLSARELECLRWTAAGKSSEEIGIILNISSHTVVSYLKSAMRKLDAVNRMQAIARACRLRLL